MFLKNKQTKTGRGTEENLLQRRHTDGQQTHEKLLNITNDQGNANQNEVSFYTRENG